MEKLTDEESLVADDVLVSILHGRVDELRLRTLPKWRAVTLARLAHKAGAMPREHRDQIVREAAVYGQVKPILPPARRSAPVR